MQGYRFEQRKKQRMNRILNMAIGIVVILILIFGAQILFGSSPSEEVMIESEDDSNEEIQQPSVPDPVQQENQTEEDSDSIDTSETDEEIDEEETEPVPDGEWEPIGTSQTGEFSHDFNRSGTNWAEMTQAIQYATGLDENMIIWRLENGGSPTRARGVVSSPDSQDRPYEVYIEWVDGHGWMPVEKQQLSSNPHRG